MNQDEFYQECEKIQGVSQKERTGFGFGFAFRMKGKGQFVEANENYDKFTAKRSGKSFEEYSEFNELGEALTWIQKIKKFI